ncbi:MAG TPA: hypothetical protein VGR11_14150 [Solirubrobacteraceae bacterium]|nr:hypothetical protein [Solirubrobacteraceae bacterium]
MGTLRRVEDTASVLLPRIRHSAPCRDTCSDDVWSARRFVSAEPPQVLEALTDPEFISLWAPVDFEVEGLRGRRLRGGSHAIVNGSLAGVAAEFEIHVLRADQAGFELQASGPIDFEVAYRFVPERPGVIVDAEIKLGSERGLNARVLRAATGALLRGGALDRALGRLAHEFDEIALLAA